MRIGSLFSGIGGIELGLETAIPGASVAWQAECDPYALAVLAKHWPEVKRYKDVREINKKATHVDIVCGGFPCQDISNAGKRAGIKGERSGLWSEYARIVRTLRPRYVFVENVAALAARGLGRVLADLAALGFDAEWDLFRASDVGAPHRRERLFILAYARRERAGRIQPESITRSSEAADAVDRGDAVAHANGGGQLQSQRSLTGERGRVSHGGQSDVVDARGIRSNTRIEGTQDGHGSGHRFPPGPRDIGAWTGAQPAIRRGNARLSGRVDRLRCLGNAVVPQVAAHAWQTLSARIA